jgi:Myb/SANT-like DNA-binding domain
MASETLDNLSFGLGFGMDGGLGKRQRTANLTRGDRDILVDLVGKYGDILECKKTDTVTWRQKEDAWKKVEFDYNAVSTNAREWKQLKQVSLLT